MQPPMMAPMPFAPQHMVPYAHEYHRAAYQEHFYQHHAARQPNIPAIIHEVNEVSFFYFYCIYLLYIFCYLSISGSYGAASRRMGEINC